MPIATALLQAEKPNDHYKGIYAGCNGRTQVFDSASLWLIGEWARDGFIADDDRDALQQLLLICCEQGDGPQVNTLLEQRLHEFPYRESAHAASFIAALGELAARTRATRNLDLIQSQIQDLAPGEVQACWQLIEEHPVCSRKNGLAGFTKRAHLGSA